MIIDIRLHPAKALGAVLGAAVLGGTCFGFFVVAKDVNTARWFLEWLLILAGVTLLSALSALLLVRGSRWARLGIALAAPIPAAALFLISYQLSSELAFMPRLVAWGPYQAFQLAGEPMDFAAGLQGGMTLKEFEAGLDPGQRHWSVLTNRSSFYGPRPGCPDCPLRYSYTVLVRPFRLEGEDGWLWATFYNGRLMRARFGMGDNPKFIKVPARSGRGLKGFIFGLNKNVDLMGREAFSEPLDNRPPLVDIDTEIRMNAFKSQLGADQCAGPGSRGCTTHSGAQLFLFDCKLCKKPFVQWEDPRLTALEDAAFGATPRVDGP